jgi:transposase
MIREILRLHHSCGLSKKKISTAIGCARSTIGDYLSRAQAAGLTWPLPAELDGDEALTHLYSPLPEKTRPQPDCNYIHDELRKKGVTITLLWDEYKQAHPDGYQLSQFSEIYRRWRKTIDLSMRQDHKAGDKLFSDFAGGTLRIVDPHTGNIAPAYLFVCALGASSYTFAKLFSHQDTEAWCTGHALAFSFFNGCVETVVPDYVSRNIIWHHNNRRSAKKLKSFRLAIAPRCRCFIIIQFCESVIAGAECAHKEVGEVNLTAILADNRQSSAGEIGKRFVATGVELSHRYRQMFVEFFIDVAKLAKALPKRILIAIFGPKL